MNVLREAVFTKLAAGTALIDDLGGTAIYYAEAPEAASLPYVVYDFPASGPENICSQDIIGATVLVKCYAATPTAAETLDNDVRALLHRGSLSVTGYSVFWLVRERDISLPEKAPNGGTIWMEGGYYRIRMA